MAEAELSKMIKSIRGKVGGLVFRQMPDGSIVVSSAPKKKRRSSKGQKAYRKGTFTDRAQWAKWAQHEYPIYARLAAERPMITAYNLAMSDIAHPPVIHRILRQEGRILVQASDEVFVNKVMVEILDEAGTLLDEGDAVQLEGDMWEYTAKVEGKQIVARAFDLPGNSAQMVLE